MNGFKNEPSYDFIGEVILKINLQLSSVTLYAKQNVLFSAIISDRWEGIKLYMHIIAFKNIFSITCVFILIDFESFL